MGYITSAKIKDHFEKAKFVLNELEPIIEKWKPEQINVEDNLSGFQSGRTSMQIIIKLAKINGIITFYLSQILKIPTENINASTARKKVLGKAYDRKNFSNTKEFVLSKLADKFGDEFIDKLPRMKRKTEKLAKEAFDICDSVIMALY
jgi:Holliday junction resolvasome RuvABC endonuclease subunit